MLVVNDELDNLQMVRQILKGDYQLSLATDGTKAIVAALKIKPDIILSPRVKDYSRIKISIRL